MKLQQAKGPQLDFIALKLGLKRRRYFLFFKERDKSLRERILLRIQMICNRQLSVLGCQYCNN